ncbi:hypothetical protein I7I48_02103 [Histoplasma ohiense]|nr:hypothetical protein I7I48_02103 [Histoplasma ohiense (nom. inval.)]
MHLPLTKAFVLCWCRSGQCFLVPNKPPLAAGREQKIAFAPENNRTSFGFKNWNRLLGIVRLVTSHSRFTKKGTAMARYVYLPENMATKGLHVFNMYCPRKRVSTSNKYRSSVMLDMKPCREKCQLNLIDTPKSKDSPLIAKNKHILL